MAIKQTNIFPIDKQPRNAVGVAFPFTSYSPNGATPFKLNYTTQDQLKSNLIIYFSTNKGERPLNPNYGGNLKRLLFEQLTSDTNEIIESIIRDELALYFPEVVLKSLEILQKIDSQQILIVMRYVVFNNEEDSLEINFNP